MIDISGEDLAALLITIHNHDSKGKIIYYEKDLLEVLEAVGLPKPIWGNILSLEDYKRKKGIAKSYYQDHK